MANMSNYLEGQLIGHLFRDLTFSKPSTLAIALCTASPNDASTGGTITEVANSNNYSRVELAPDDDNWAAISGNNGTTSNSSAITFPTASGSWGTVTSVAILDSATHGAGNVLFYGDLTVSKSITSGDTFSFSIGALTIQIDN